MWLYMDFVYDFTKIVTEVLEMRKAKGIRKLSPSRRFSILFDAESRQVPLQRYNVKISDELRSKPQWYPLRGALAEVVDRFKKGETLQPYLSRFTEKIKKVDQLLQHWGINHLHLSSISTKESDGFVVRADYLLLFRISGNDVHLIDVLPHELEHLWSQPELVRIMDRNWPFLCMPVRGAVALDRQLDAENYKILRNKNALAAVETDRGVVMATLGVNTAGTSAASMREWDRLVIRLRRLQDLVQRNYETIFMSSRTYVSSLQLLSVEEDGFVIRDGATGSRRFVANTYLN